MAKAATAMQAPSQALRSAKHLSSAKKQSVPHNFKGADPVAGPGPVPTASKKEITLGTAATQGRHLSLGLRADGSRSVRAKKRVPHGHAFQAQP